MQTTPELDLFIMDSHDIRLMAVVDISSYPDGFTIVSPTLTVNIPGYSKDKLIPFVPRNINILNSSTLDITCQDRNCQHLPLPDGVYTFKYAVAPGYKYNVTKTFLRAEAIYAKFDLAFLHLEMFQCDMQTKRNKKMELEKAENYIQGAIAAANRCANDLAMELYHKADYILNQFS